MSQGQGINIQQDPMGQNVDPAAADQARWQQEQKLAQMGALSSPSAVPAQASNVSQASIGPGLASGVDSVMKGVRARLSDQGTIPGTQFDSQGIPIAQAANLGGQ